ncbi:DUF4190 domain-containing protein [Butyrivibrio sp. AE2032]|uniref:DUF4190 domain-containing protein n=1 Tax=Butyrivibrio sp. AE2032 TaxID=1458463 RepID=UPI00068D832D|nr:DUF4190 domain-containing protein [Butyrivibrio sp. AE2032]
MYCESCGSFIPEGQAVCPTCGAQAPQAEPQPVVQQTAQPVYQPVYQQPVYQQPAQPVYQQPVYQPVYQPAPQPVVIVQTPPARSSNGAAVVGLVFGILTICFCWVPFLVWVFGLVGLICSIVGIAKKNAGKKGAAIAGLIMSILGSLISIVYIGALFSTSLNSYIDKAEQAAASYQTYDTDYVS